MQIYRRALAEDGFSDIARFDPASAPEACDLSRPTVLFFPGVQTTDGAQFADHPAEEALDHKSEVVLRHLGGGDALADERMRLFTLTYSPQPHIWVRGAWTNAMGRTADIVLSNRRPHDYFSRDAKRLVEALILPGLTEPLAARDMPTIDRKLANLTLVADSYGGVFAEQVANVLQHEFRLAGLEEDRIRGLLKRIHVVAASNVPLRNGDNRMTGVYFEARGDTMIDAARDNHAMSLLRHAARSVRAFGDRIDFRPQSDLACRLAVDRAKALDNGWRYGRIILASMRDKVPFNRLDQAEIAAVLAEERADAERAPGRPHVPFAVGDVALGKVGGGMVVTFNAPPQFKVVLRSRRGEIGIDYPDNESRHHSYGYTYPVPGHRDHADLFGRVLCHSVRRGETGRAIGAREMLATPTETFGTPRHPEIDRRLESVIERAIREQDGPAGDSPAHTPSPHVHQMEPQEAIGWDWSVPRSRHAAR